MPKPLTLNLTIPIGEPSHELLQLIKTIRPDWHATNLKYTHLAGLTNQLIKIDNRKRDGNDAFLVRLDGHRTDTLIDRENEKRNIVTLSDHGLGAKLYAIFNNGLAYEYVTGVTVTPQTVRDQNVWPLIGRRLAQIHRTIPCVVTNHEETTFWLLQRKFLTLLNGKTHFHSIITPDVLSTEFQCVNDAILRLDNLNIVFCHNDLLLGNIIANGNAVEFIDFEYAGFNFQCFDVANHFCEFPGVDNIDYGLFPTRVFQREWIRVYLREYFLRDVDDGDVDEMLRCVDVFVPACHLLWGVWALVQAERSRIDFDYFAFARARIEQYFVSKSLICQT